LGSVDTQSARELARFRGVVRLDGLLKLPDPVAEAFVDNGKRLSDKTSLVLDGVDTLGDTAAGSLGRWLDESGGALQMNGLIDLPVSTAKALQATKGKLTLNGVTRLNDAAAEVLGQFGGILELDGLVSPSFHALELLARCRGWQPTCVIKLTPELTRAFVSEKAKLGERDGEPALLCLPNLRQVSVEAAKELAKLPGRLELIKLESASREVAVGPWHASI